MKRASIPLALMLVLFTGWQAQALISMSDEGTWPATWPKELDSLRKRSRTLDVATGTQEHIYTIPFASRDEFEKLWPILMTLRTPGSPLKLSKTGSENEWGRFLSNAVPCVRIKGPTGAYVGARLTPDNRIDLKQLDEGTMLYVGAPWPKSLIGPRGELPEYVTSVSADGGKLTWKSLEDVPEGKRGFHNRARVDLELVIDGKVIDLNRIPLPQDAPLVDVRFPTAAKP
ncbi:MAG: hypothetical protein JSS49_29720 [Planctomycetes bacterium]|nr:hypothetical protein [Planctomycetota bacterium]